MTPAKRYAIYARVSTARQAEHDLSIPDQLAQARRYAAERGGMIAAEYVEPGASARDDKRPQFQAMIEAACVRPAPFDIILVHSLSRFFRDEISFVTYVRRLKKHGVKVVSLTQEFGEGSGAEIALRITALMDEMQSEENAKHVRRAMIENARQGFWNGPALFGYVAEAAEQRGQKVKKRLAINPREAETVRLIFKLFMEGDGVSGPLGVKHIAKWLNARGHRTPDDKPYYTSRVHAILTKETYAGRAWFNRIDSRTRRLRPRDEWIAVRVPAIIPEAMFRRVQAMLKERRPDRTPPRITNSKVLLTGVAVCEACGGPMMLATGKKGAYRYYKCSARHLRGECASGKPIREARLDALTLDALTGALLTPERVRDIVGKVAERRANGRTDALHGLAQLRGQLGRVKNQLRNLVDALADGVIGDTETFRAKMASLEQERADIERLIETQELSASAALKPISLDQAKVAAQTLRKAIMDAPPELKKRYIRAFVSKITVGKDQIRIEGPESALAEAASGVPPAHIAAANPAVRGLGREWRARKDSNL